MPRRPGKIFAQTGRRLMPSYKQGIEVPAPCTCPSNLDTTYKISVELGASGCSHSSPQLLTLEQLTGIPCLYFGMIPLTQFFSELDLINPGGNDPCYWELILNCDEQNINNRAEYRKFTGLTPQGVYRIIEDDESSGWPTVQVVEKDE